MSSEKSEIMSEEVVASVSMMDSIIPLLLKVGTIVVGMIAVSAGLLYAKQDSLLYFPEIGGIPRSPRDNPRKYRSPEEHNIPFETHMIPCEDGVNIHSWLLLHPASRGCPTVVMFHGNAGNIGLRIPNAIQMFNYLKANILLVEYRGYGDSDDARINEAGLKLDAEASLRFIRTHAGVDASRIFVFGRSLGGAVAFHLAQYAQEKNLPLAGIIVENTFLSIAHMVDKLMPYVAPLKFLILRIGWHSYKIAPKISVPILYLAGKKDQLVPHSHMKELYQLSKQASVCARIHVVLNGTHNETWMQGGRSYWDKIRSFINEVVAGNIGGNVHRASSTSMESIQLDERSPGLQVGSGAASQQDVTSSIPIIPGNLIGIAKEAMASKPESSADKKAQ